jgi:hypothetical protein
MKNQYEVSEDGRTVTIWLNRKGERYACLIDAVDLPKLKSLRNTWHALWNAEHRSFRATSHVRINGVQRFVYMHRFIADQTQGGVVIHRNHDGLDNRRENLQAALRARGRGPSRKPRMRCVVRRGSKTGEVGICPVAGKYKVQVTVGSERKYLGLFSTIEEAIAVRNQYPEYARTA